MEWKNLGGICWKVPESVVGKRDGKKKSRKGRELQVLGLNLDALLPIKQDKEEACDNAVLEGEG